MLPRSQSQIQILFPAQKLNHKLNIIESPPAPQVETQYPLKGPPNQPTIVQGSPDLYLLSTLDRAESFIISITIGS